MKYLVTEKTASFLRKIQQSGGYTGKPGPTRREVPSRGLPDLYPPPFTVRWSFSENDGAGAWCIWLPDLAKLFAYGGTYAALTGVTACQVLPEGWYTVDDSTGATDTAMYLVVTIADDDTITSAVISVEEGEAVTGTTVVNIPVAAMAVDATTGAKSVKQFVDSAVLLGGGGGGGGSSYTPMDEPFDIEDGYVVRCVIPAPIAELTCSDYAINTEGGNIYAHVDRDTNGFTLSVDQTSRANSTTHAQWVLYEYSNGEATCDRRPKILPLFDLS